jgi:two-component system cell cycle sensor histidine kinase/response regulator CckA
MEGIAQRYATLAPSRAATRPGTLNTVHVALGLVASGALAAMALFASGSAEPIVLALLALLAVGGVFFVLGLASGVLRLSERAGEAELAKGIADGLESGLEMVGKDGTVLYQNRALGRVLGTGDGGFSSIQEALAADPHAAQALFRLNRAAERCEVREEEIFVRLPHGTRQSRWLRVSVRPLALRMARGREERATLWQAQEITRERVREVEVARGLEATLACYDSLPQGLLAVAPDGRIHHLNATLAQWLGLRRDAGRALTIADIVAADGAALIRAAVRSLGGRPLHFDVDFVREDGRVFPAHVVCRGRTPISAEIAPVLVLDRATLLPRDGGCGSGQRLVQLFRAAPFGIAIADHSGRIVDANNAFLRMFLSERGASPATLSELVAEAPEETRRELAKGLERALGGRPTVAPIEIAFGPQRELARRIHITPLGTGGGEREAAILYAIDASGEKALEAKFAQSQKMEAIGKLAGGIAHDFNNVLTAIIGFSDLLLQTHRPTDPAYRDIMNIKQSANRAAGMVRQLLAFSRRQTLQAEVLQLGEVLTDLSALLNRAMGEKIELKITSGRDLWYVKADKTQFEQVIINLAVNARDAMPDGGRLTIRTRNVSERESLKLASLGVAAGEYVLIEVEDTGVGMSPEVMSNIFEPFFSTKEVGKGTGLGLSTVYGFVKQTGGYVFPESAVGEGTTFRIYLPRHIVESEEEIAHQRREKKREAVRDLTGTGRVLLVEDEDAVRNFAARALARQGYEVLEAATGLEALEVMARERGRVDIVVSDVVMPEMDGPTLLKELRKTNPNLKMIFVSGYPDDAFRKSLDENEEYTFLPKPFTLPQLAAKVKEQLGR